MFSGQSNNTSALTALLSGQSGGVYPQLPAQFPVQAGMQSVQSKRTAVHDLEAFLTSLPGEDCAAVIGDPAFQGESQRLKAGFLSWLLSGEIGTAYVESKAKEQAERVLATARAAHARATEKQRGDMDAMRAKIEELEAMLLQKGGGVSDAK